jgi:hypothetical protein
MQVKTCVDFLINRNWNFFLKLEVQKKNEISSLYASFVISTEEKSHSGFDKDWRF